MAFNGQLRVYYEPQHLHWIWKETDRKLDVLGVRVREGVEVLVASDFVRWLEFSGLIQLFEENPWDGDMRVDGKQIREKVEALIYDCGEWFRLHENSFRPRGLEIPRCEMEKVNRRLEQIEEHLSKLSPPETHTAPVVPAALHVMPGGSFAIRVRQGKSR
jgi:hypothetical protein